MIFFIELNIKETSIVNGGNYPIHPKIESDVNIQPTPPMQPLLQPITTTQMRIPELLVMNTYDRHTNCLNTDIALNMHSLKI